MTSYFSNVQNLVCKVAFAVTVIAVATLSIGTPRANADLVSYDVGDFSNSGFSASVVHAATSSSFGTGADAGKRGGAKSSMLSGTLGGDLVSDVLSGISGSLTGTLAALSPTFSTSSGTSFEMKLGSTAGSGKSGSLIFETSGSGSGEFNGGYIDYALHIDGSGSAASTGTLFFQAEDQGVSGSGPLNPNRGDSAEFTLWGNNYMHSGNGYDSSDWATLLTPLGYSGFVGRSDTDTPLGIDLFARIDLSISAVPEPSQVLAWSILSLAICGFGYRGKREGLVSRC